MPIPSAPPAESSRGAVSAPRGRGRGRGRGAGPRPPIEMTASGPFAMGPSARPTSSRAAVRAAVGPGTSRTPSTQPDQPEQGEGGVKSDPSRSAYRNPDKLKDAEQYSDPEDDGVEIIDIDEVHALDELAPRALPRMAEKATKKEKRKAAEKRKKVVENRIKAEEGSASTTVKQEPEGDVPMFTDEERLRAQTVSSGSATPQLGSDDEKANQADALDLSESENEELMDDLVDDFVFDDDDDTSPENRLYLFQFPQRFPDFARQANATTELKDDPSKKKRRSVAFAEGTTGGGGSAGTEAKKDESDSEEDDEKSETGADSKEKVKQSRGVEGQIGRLDVYRDGRVFFRFGDLVMEVTGGSQTTFLQEVMVLDAANETATSLGEVHRKFIVTPELDCMLADFAIHDAEQRKENERIKREEEERLDRERVKFGGMALGARRQD